MKLPPSIQDEMDARGLRLMKVDPSIYPTQRERRAIKKLASLDAPSVAAFRKIVVSRISSQCHRISDALMQLVDDSGNRPNEVFVTRDGDVAALLHCIFNASPSTLKQGVVVVVFRGMVRMNQPGDIRLPDAERDAINECSVCGEGNTTFVHDDCLLSICELCVACTGGMCPVCDVAVDMDTSHVSREQVRRHITSFGASRADSINPSNTFSINMPDHGDMRLCEWCNSFTEHRFCGKRCETSHTSFEALTAIQKDATTTTTTTTAAAEDADDCPICLEKMEEGVMDICSNHHSFHATCWESAVEFNKRKGLPASCPYCREIIT
jgi:hypothetical protein